MNLPNWLPQGNALTFAHPWLLLLLLALPVLAYLRGQRGPAAALIFSSTTILRGLGKSSAARAGKFLRALLFLTLALFVIALARPQLGKSLTQVEASGIDIMLVLDVSGSMLTKDFTVGGDPATRVDAIREVTRKFIEGRPNDRIGIIAFAGRPYVVSPMTLDHDWLLQNLERVRIGLVEDGTAIGSGIAAAANRLNDKQSKSRVLVLLTDGENNAGKIPPNTAAEAVKALQIHLYAIGAGINGIAPAPVFDRRGGIRDRSLRQHHVSKPAGSIQRSRLEGSRPDRGRTILPRDRHEIARTDLRGYRQAGEIDRERKEVSGVPRSFPRLHHGRLRLAPGADSVVADDLEEAAVRKCQL